MSTSLTFDESATEFVLEAFGKEIDSEGYIIDAETGERETTLEGTQIQADELAGLEKGSIRFIDDNFVSLVEHVQRRNSE